MQDGCKVYMDSYMALQWIVFHGHLGLVSKKQLLEVGLPQNRVIMALQTLTTVDLFHFIMCEGLHE